ncbi:MAG: right-handed parallel beta-helix repeat-containing protein, partial [Myxococcaceae bacterium]
WDWDNNGSCDTAYTTSKLDTHDYTAAGTYTIGMKVKDAAGQVSSTTRQITFQNVQYIGGTSVTTTTWYGTIIVTGDITVPSGNVLTIASGTQVLFVKADTNSDGIGDYGILIQGKLDVQGTAASPVLFSGQSSAAKAPGSWDRIQITGTTPSTISYATIEYADVGLDIKNGSSVSNVTVRQTRSDCIYLDNADGAALSVVTTTLCGRAGVAVNNGSTGVTIDQLTSKQNTLWGIWESASSGVTMTNSLLQSNGEDGAWVGTGSSFNLSDSTSELNTKAGVAFLSTSSGTVTRNQVRSNGREGVGLRSDGAGDPNPTVTLNNIYSNGTSGSMLASTVSASLSASYTCCGSSTTSSTYSAPTGKTINRVFVSYSETDGASYVTGKVLDGAGNTLQTLNSNFSGWLFVPDGTTSVKVNVGDTGWSSATDTISVTQVELLGTTGASDVVAVTSAGTPNFQNNYLGTWPNVLSRVSMTRTSALNLQVFVGAQFGSGWVRDPYKSGTLAAQTWSGTVYVTGDITIPAGVEVIVSAGTDIEFVKHDQNQDGAGDFTLTANGKLTVQGSVTSPVVFKAQGTSTGDAFQRIVLAGTTSTNASTWTYANVINGKTALELRGPSNLTKVTVQGGSGDAVYLNGSTGALLTDLVVSGAGGKGVYLNNADGTILTRPDIEGSTGPGIDINNGSTGVQVSHALVKTNSGGGIFVQNASTPLIEDSTIQNNGWAGVFIWDASPSVNYNLITYNNGNGFNIQGSSSATTASYNIVKFNNDTGVAIWQTASGAPGPTLNYSNIYGNAVMGSYDSTFVNPNLSASYTCCGSSTTSSTYTAPSGSAIHRVYVSYSETDGASYVSGQLLDGAGNNLKTFTSNFTGWVYVPANVTSVKVNVGDTGWSSATDTISVTNAELTTFTAADHYEVVDSTETGTANLKFNYWTSDVASVPTKFNQTRANSVDYSGYTGAEYPSGTVTQVGPRP